jgi:hypothetical protein
MFTPIIPPPTEHHPFSTGHATENGDNAKTVGEKINAGFKHVYDVLAGMGASLSDEIEYVAKSEFDLLVHELEEAKAELANLKMMVQGLGFAGARTAVLGNPAIIDPSHSMTFTPTGETVAAPSKAQTGLSWDGLVAGGEPVVTVKEADAQ